MVYNIHKIIVLQYDIRNIMGVVGGTRVKDTFMGEWILQFPPGN